MNPLLAALNRVASKPGPRQQQVQQQLQRQGQQQLRRQYRQQAQQVQQQLQQQRQIPPQHRIEKRSLSGDSMAVESFVILREAEDEVRALADDIGVELEIAPVAPESLRHLFPPIERTAYGFGYGEPDPRTAYERARDEYCERKARRYLRVTARAPQPPERVIGMASSKPGVTVFYTFPGEDDPWTKKRMEQMDFRRCDLCHRRILRVNSYLVMRPDGSIFVAGGQCADNLNLAKRVSNLKRIFKDFRRSLEERLDDWDLDMDGRGAKADPAVDPGTALVVADALIGRHGYRRSNDEGSTKDELGTLLLSNHPKVRRRLGEILSDLPEGHREKLMGRVDAWLDHEQQRAQQRDDGLAFVNNMRAAVTSGSLRLLGFLAYVPEGLRRWEGRRRQRRQGPRHQPWAPEIPLIYEQAGWTLSGRGSYRQYEFEPEIAGVSVRIVTTDPARQQRPQEQAQVQGRASAELLRNARYMVRHAPARNVRLAYVSGRVVDEYGSPAREIYLGRALTRAMGEALGQEKAIPVPTGADLVRIVDSYPEAQGLMGLTDRQVAAARKKPAKRVAKGTAGKLMRYVPGLWTVKGIHTVESQWGDMHFVRFLRESDGSLLQWKANTKYVPEYVGDDGESVVTDSPIWYGGTGYLEQGDKVWIKSATVGLVPPPHPTYGQEGRKILRVKFVLVDGPSRRTAQQIQQQQRYWRQDG